MKFSLDWFLTVPGMLITGGILLLIIAIIISVIISIITFYVLGIAVIGFLRQGH